MGRCQSGSQYSDECYAQYSRARRASNSTREPLATSSAPPGNPAAPPTARQDGYSCIRPHNLQVAAGGLGKVNDPHIPADGGEPEPEPERGLGDDPCQTIGAREPERDKGSSASSRVTRVLIFSFSTFIVVSLNMVGHAARWCDSHLHTVDGSGTLVSPAITCAYRRSEIELVMQCASAYDR